MHTHIYVHTSIRMYVHAYVYIHMCMHSHPPARCTHTHPMTMYVYTYIHCTYKFVNCMQIHTHMGTCMQRYITELRGQQRSVYTTCIHVRTNTCKWNYLVS